MIKTLLVLLCACLLLGLFGCKSGSLYRMGCHILAPEERCQ